MSQYNRSASNRDLVETFMDFIGGVAKVLVWLGLCAFVVGIGFLLFNIFGTNPTDSSQVAQAVSNVHTLSKVLDAGVLGLSIGLTYLFWGEETLGVLILLGSAALYFAPLVLPGMAGTQSEAGTAALASIQMAGVLGGIVGIVVVVASVAIAVKERTTMGARKESLKLGREVKAEKTQNVLLGSCWQLPFCRKFVRERCPIYHAKRTCWRELVGCMCEEEIIMNAMQNKPISKGDLLSAATMIPRNHRLTDAQKRTRCKSCVIYNEHLRHKYRVTVPVIMVGFALIYVLTRGAISGQFSHLIETTGGMINHLTLQKPGATVTNPPVWLAELLTAVVFVLAMSYCLKIVEYLFFTLKV